MILWLPCSKHLLNFWLERERIFRWFTVSDNFTIFVDEEFGEIPRYVVGFLVFSVVQWTVLAKEVVHWVCVQAFDFNLWKHREFDVVCLSGPSFDICFTIRLLTPKLVAWERKDFEAFATELLMELYHFSVVSLSIFSLGCHVYNQHAFLIFCYRAKRVYHYSIDIHSRVRPQWLVLCLCHVFCRPGEIPALCLYHLYSVQTFLGWL